MSESNIRPALTAGEWKVMSEFSPRVLIGANQRSIGVSELRGELRHSLAALALCGQKFGFTREDLDMLQAATCAAEAQMYEPERLRILHSLAARIEALLPPEVP